MPLVGPLHFPAAAAGRHQLLLLLRVVAYTPALDFWSFLNR
jgi:hypothetical protein